MNGRGQKAGTALRSNVGDFAHDILTLSELQGRLFLVDLQEAKNRAIRPIALGVVGVVLLVASLPVALLGLAELLVLAGLPQWAAFLVAALVGILASGVLGWMAWRSIRTTFAVFERSRDEFSQNLTWIKAALRSSSRQQRPQVSQVSKPR
jgi:uncharacterized membrane protein YqjE